MYNEKIRKLTSLMLMAVMVAGGMTVASSGMMPAAHAADDELTVSAQEVGNFAGIQVIEIVIQDSDRSSTEDSEGIPDVEINNKDILMTQADDGSWYAYVANQIAITAYESVGSNDITDIYGEADVLTGSDILSGSDAQAIYNSTGTFLDGYKTISPADGSGTTPDNNPSVTSNDWPFIQAFDIGNVGKKTVVSIDYGSSETVTIDYEYDDDKDITLDRDNYPENAYINISLDDSLLNLSPTADDIWAFSVNGSAYYITDVNNVVTSTQVDWDAIGFEEGPLIISNDDNVITFVDTDILDAIQETDTDNTIIFKTSNLDENLFVNYDNSDQSGLKVVGNGDAYIGYTDNHSVLFDTFNGALEFVGPAIEEWLSGVEIELILTDEDRNLNSRSDESLGILEGEVPFIKIGNPLTVDKVTIVNSTGDVIVADDTTLTGTKTISITIDEETSNTITASVAWPTKYTTAIDNGYIFPYVNYDFTAFGGSSGTLFAGNTTGYDNVDGDSDVSSGDSKVFAHSNSTNVAFDFTIDNVVTPQSGVVYFDVFFYGQLDDVATNGAINDNVDRVNDAIYRFALEETDDNTANFEGQVEYIMINQLNVFDQGTYDRISTDDESIIIIVNDDMDGADSVTVSYEDTDSTSSVTTISVQEAANTHTGYIELDSESYSSGNTVEVTLVDFDLNTDSDTIQTYDVDSTNEWVGDSSVWLSQLKINDILYDDRCSSALNLNLGLSDTGFTLRETAKATGIFVGTFKLPLNYCTTTLLSETTNGNDLEFEYQDYSDASGEPNESSFDATIRSNTGSVTLDSSVYPVPFADDSFLTYDGDLTKVNTSGKDEDLGVGSVTLTIQVNDPDFNIASSGEDTMDSSYVTLQVARGSDKTSIAIDANELLIETDPESGIFEIEVVIPYADYALGGTNASPDEDSINQSDILTVTYTDPNDAGGDSNTVTDSATFDLRTGVLQTDKTEYVIGSEAIITLIEPDLNLDTDNAETWSLDLVNWDSDAGDANLSDDIFDANPAGFRETGDNTGIFQTVIEIPQKIGTDTIERGERITLEYQDNGPSGGDYIGDDDQDVTAEIAASNYGASVTLDQRVYTWTDKVYVTIVSPDHNFDSNAIDEIGDSKDNEININTRDGGELEQYKLVETGADTGIFVGEIILTGFAHDADGDNDDTDAPNTTIGSGPTSGLLQASDNDGLSVSFEASDGDTVIGSALIRWNIGEVQWLEASYPASGSGVLRVIDPDMNWNPESVDSFDITVWSDSSAGGVSLSVTETNEATGIFEGTVQFSTTQGSSGSRLAVHEGDTITAEYEDHTLPDPYSTADELSVTATANIGSIVPPLERAPAGNLRAVDAFGNSIDTISLGQQIQVEVDVANGQDREQDFAYLLQVQDENGVTVKLTWVTGTLTSGQQFTSAASWIPQIGGDYKATAFVWESVNNPTALSPPVSTTLIVR